MDSGPFSTPQPADRRAVSRPEQAYRPKEPQQPAEEPARVAHRPAPTPRSSKPKRSFKWLIISVVIVVVVVLLAVGGWLLWSRSQNTDSAINQSEYQAVFLTNGQIYVGKLSPYNSTYLKLTGAFIASSSQPSTVSKDGSTDNGVIQLKKVTDTILGPHDAIFIERSQVMLYENLQPNGKTTKSIEQYNGK